MTVTLGTPYENLDGVDDATTNSFWLVELPGIDDKAVVFYTVNDTSNYKLHARVISTSGDSVSSVAAEQTLVTSVDGNDIIDRVNGEAYDANTILVVWRQRPSSYEMNAAIATVSGNTVTIGAVRQVRNTVSATELVYGTWISSGSIMCVYVDSANSNMYVAACTVSGDTVSAPGTEVAIDTTLGSVGQNTMAIKGAGDDSRAVVLWDDASNLQVRVAKITSGTTITVHTVNSFIASSSVQGERLRKIPGDTTTFIGQWQRGINPIPEAVHITIDTGDDTIDLGTVETWHAADAQNNSAGLCILSASWALTAWTDGIGTPEGMVSEMGISGTTLTVDEAEDAALAKSPALQIVKVGANKALVLYNDVDAVVTSTDEITPPAPQAGIVGLSIMPAREAAGYAWGTFWLDDHMELRRLNLSTKLFDRIYDLGDATLEEIQARTRGAWVWAVTDEICFIFGRMDAPGQLTGDQHIVYLDESLSFNFDSVENGWGSDICAALHIGFPSGSNRQYFAVRESASAVPKFYYGTNDFASNVDLPFAPAIQVPHRGIAFSLPYLQAVVVALSAASGVVAARASSPYTTWTDISDDYPTPMTGRSVAYLTGNG